MSNFNMDDILAILRQNAQQYGCATTSAFIEAFLAAHYRPEKYQLRKKAQFEEKRPLVNRALYDLIKQERALPKLPEFLASYFKQMPYDLANQPADRYLLSLAYVSLIRDLHFYFVLEESGHFTDVTIDYLYDLYGQTDILLAKDEKRLGLQLFHGSKNAEISKHRDLQERQHELNYPLILFSTKDARGERLVLNDGDIVLYSVEDADVILDLLLQGENLQFDDSIHSEETDSFEFIDVEAIAEVTKYNKQSSPTEIFHSVLIVGQELIEQELAATKRVCEPHGVTIYEYPVSTVLLQQAGLAPAIFVDGLELTDEWKKFLREHAESLGFNIDQYLIEHTDSEADINISAGAGSGKTYTLVSRALYLLNTNKITSIDEIAMITFTNEAADNMRIRLAERFIELYKQTKKVKYRKYLEDLRNMRIQTIPSFAKAILQQFGHYIGLGSQFKVANLIMERRQIIEAHLNEYTLKTAAIQDVFKSLQYHNVIKFIEQVWEKIEQKGLMTTDIIDCTQQTDPFSQVINETLVAAEIEFNAYKIKNNMLTLADLTRYLKELAQTKAPLHLLQDSFRYLFVDEFQDSDNAQIDFISYIAGKAGIHLLVVGDIKQNIYRFRGANMSAFNMLGLSLQRYGRQPLEEALVYNYRTEKVLLDAEEDLFDAWRQNDWLPRADARMVAKRSDASLTLEDALCFSEASLTIEEIETAFHAMTQEEGNKVLAILVRTNPQAIAIGKLLQSLNDSPNPIPYDVSLDGTLFQSTAAKDLLMLLESWIKPDDPVTLYNFSKTAFCQNGADVTISVGQHFEVHTPYTFKVPKMWIEAQELLKYNPILMVINEFLAVVPYEENLTEPNEPARKKYQLNLYKVLSMLYAKLGDSNLDLLTIHSWLALQIATNRLEDEAELEAADFDNNSIKVMTVHKSKGLEFDTVIIPNVEKKFIRYEPKTSNLEEFDFNALYMKSYANVLVHRVDGVMKYGWLYYNKDDRFIHKTAGYESLKYVEETEAIQEETRILYVAMTRAKRRLLIYGLQDKSFNLDDKPKIWGDLLNMRGHSNGC